MLTEVNIQQHIGKSRAPDDIQERVSHYIGEAHGTFMRTNNWAKIRTWYYANRHRQMLRVVAVCEEETNEAASVAT